MFHSGSQDVSWKTHRGVPHPARISNKAFRPGGFRCCFPKLSSGRNQLYLRYISDHIGYWGLFFVSHVTSGHKLEPADLPLGTRKHVLARNEKSEIQFCFPLLLLLGIGALISFSALKKKKSQSCHGSDKIQTVCYTSNYQSAFWVKWYDSIIGFVHLSATKKKNYHCFQTS